MKTLHIVDHFCNMDLTYWVIYEAELNEPLSSLIDELPHESYDFEEEVAKYLDDGIEIDTI